MPSPISDVVSELDLVKRDCLKLITDMKAFYPLADAQDQYPVTFRLMVLPMLYAAWERCFVLSNAIAWKRLREETATAGLLLSSEKAAWLMREGFYESYRKVLLNAAGSADSKKPQKSHYGALAAFLGELDTWSTSALDRSIDTDDLVMTFSNVNEKVVQLNAEAFGMNTFPAFQQIQFGRLNDLVGARNDIGHGGTLLPPPHRSFCDLCDFTENLVEKYSELFKAWVVHRFPPPSAPRGILDRIRDGMDAFGAAFRND